MPDLWVIAGLVLIPLTFGLVPAFLPLRVPLRARWASWLALLIVTAAYGYSLRGAEPFNWLVLVSFSVSSLLSLYVLAVETTRSRAGKARP